MKGYVQVYTGNGKGKTTAALGQSIRAVGAGFKVFIGQFAKGKTYSELESLKRFSDQIVVKQYGTGRFIRNNPDEEDIRVARAGLEEIRQVSGSGEYNLVIMDEANIAIHYNLFSMVELLEVVNNRHKSVELIITGRYAQAEILEKADLVTEMKDVKHYYQDGVAARIGIEK